MELFQNPLIKYYNMRQKYSKPNFKHTGYSTMSLLFVAISFFGVVITAVAQEPDLAWVKRFGSTTVKASGGIIATDNLGNSYIAAPLASNAPFNLDGIVIPSSNPYAPAGYLAKYNSQGEIIWAIPTAGVNILSDLNTDKILIDPLGNIYLSGDYYSGQNSAINGYTLSTFDIDNQSTRNFFLAKLTPDGNVTWIRTALANPEYSSISPFNDIHFDLEGNIIMTGTFRGSITFLPEPALLFDEQQCAVFLTKFSPDGSILFSRVLEGGVEDPYESTISNTEQVKPDSFGNLYRWSNGPGNTGIKKLYRYNANGDLLTTKTLQYSITPPIGYPDYKSLSLPGFAIDLQGNVVVSGEFRGANIIIEGSTFFRYGTVQTNSDALVVKFTGEETGLAWVHQAQFSNNDNLSKVIADGLGNIYAVGNLWAPGERKMLMRKLSSSGTILWQKTLEGLASQTQPLGIIDPISICQANNGGNLWVSGIFDKNVYFNAQSHFICPTATTNHWNGFLAQYGTCNTEQPTINTLETTQICAGETVELSANFTDPDLTYRWNTGATTETITVNHPGIYYVIAQENDECYGKSQEIWITGLPVPQVVTAFENGIFTAVTDETNYQWIECSTQNPIEGETGVTFTPIQAGIYAVVVTNASGCTTRSECRTVTPDELDIQGFLSGLDITLYPNPAKDILQLKTSLEVLDITILNMLGQTVFNGRGNRLDVSALPSGQYMLKATTDRGIWKAKFIKQ